MSALLITTQYATSCLSCDEGIEVDDSVWWVKNVGVWHEDCPEPRSLQTYIREAEQREHR
ncbi:hypothetical protein LCGC14_0446760 [marine sediment metagenome]|uniref:Uncharacterized protein n=1 Tax=marine sediment metagenome TaxID=412755 RepID=A0A0F9SIW5_9ZZZZ